MKTLIKAAAYGLAIGSLIELLISMIMSIATGNPHFIWGTPDFLEQFGDNTLAAAAITKVVYALIGVLSQLASRVYYMEKLSLLASSALHSVLIFLMIALAGGGLRWFPISAAGIALFVGIFVFVSYPIVWGVHYAVLSRQVKTLNTHLGNTVAMP